MIPHDESCAFPTQYAINPLPSHPTIIDLVNRSVPEQFKQYSVLILKKLGDSGLLCDLDRINIRIDQAVE